MANLFESGVVNSALEARVINVEFGPIPDNPSYVSEEDIKALEDYYKQHPDQFPSGEYIDVKEWENWRNISIKYNEDNNKWTVSYRGFFKGEEVVREFNTEEEAQSELAKLKNYNKQIALELIGEARNFAIGVNGETPVPAEEVSSNTPASERPAEGEVNEAQKLTREKFGPMPENPDYLKSIDTQALIKLYEFKPDEFPNNNWLNIEKWNEWTTIGISQEDKRDPNSYCIYKINSDTSRTIITNSLDEKSANTKYSEIKNEDKQKALDLLRKARNFAIGVDLDTPWTDPVDISGETVMGSESAVTPLLDAETTSGVGTPNPEVAEVQAIYSEDHGEDLPEVEELGKALDELVDEIVTQESKNTETGGALARIDGKIYPGEGELEALDKSTEIKQLKQEAHEAIQRYKEFGERHAPNFRTESIQDTYRQLEKVAWDKVRKLAYKLGGNISQELPQLRDILTAHRDLNNISDAKKYFLEQGNIIVNEEGNITHIVDEQNNSVELKRPRTFEDIFDKSRPVHILFRTDEEGKKIGYVVDGLNENTLTWIETTLSGNTIPQAEIIDETRQSIPESGASTVTDPETPEQTEGGEDLPIDNPDRGSLYYQEIQLWNNIQALENRQKENPKDESVKVELDQAKQAYQEFRSTVSSAPEQDKFKQFLELRESYAQAESEKTRGRFLKLLGLKKKNNSELEDIRSQYNEALEALLKTETSIDVEGKIKEMFSDEVQRLSGERVVQTKELQEKNQSGLDRALNPLKDRIFNWYIKNKSAVGAVNLGLFATSTLLAFTGAGIPLAGAVNTLRHTIAYPMAVASGISSRELIRSKFEDENTNLNLDIKKFNLKTNFEFLKFKGGITKLVDKSLQENYIQNASDEDLSKLVSTLESYYGLNGGKFTELSQQKAYEMGLNELGARLEMANNQSTDEQEISNESNAVYGLDYKFDFKNTKEFKIKTVEGLVTRISQDRISALNDQKNKRLVANVAGTALGSSLLFNLVAQDLQLNKPNLGDSVSTTGESRPKIPTTDPTPEVKGTGAGLGSSGGVSAPEAGTGSIKPLNTPSTPTPGEGVYPPAPDLPSPEEALRMRQAAAAAEKAQQLAQDVSSLDSGETIWGEIAKQLGPDASQGQIQEAVEKYLGSIKGQDTIFKLAQQTEGGRELLSQWGIDNAGEMAGLSKEQLYEVSKYLGEGKLDGLTGLSLDNLDALKQAEYVAPSPTEAPTIEPGSTEPPAPPAGTQSPIAPPSPVEAPVNTSQFTKSLSEAIGTNNLTDSQIGSVLEAYVDTEQGRESLYNLIITSEANNLVISEILNEYSVTDVYHLSDLPANQLYALAQEVGVENLDKLPGFELNEIILSKFENAPDTVELVKGSKPLDMINRYIASEVGNLPYDASLGQQILNTYLETPQGKQWLYDAIINNPDKLNGNQNIQFVEEYFRQKGIKSGVDINWLDLTQDRRFPTSIFWRETALAGGRRIPPLSTLLQPSQMSGIKEAVRQVLTR